MYTNENMNSPHSGKHLLLCSPDSLEQHESE